MFDGSAQKQLTNSSAWSKVDHGKCSNTLKTGVHKDSGASLVSARPAPLRASWADAKPMIVPLRQNLADVSLKRGSPEKTSEGKNGMAQFKSHGIRLCPIVKSSMHDESILYRESGFSAVYL